MKPLRLFVVDAGENDGRQLARGRRGGVHHDGDSGHALANITWGWVGLGSGSGSGLGLAGLAVTLLPMLPDRGMGGVRVRFKVLG